MNLKFRAFSDGGFQMDRAVVGSDDPTYDRKTKSGSVLLARHKGTEDIELLFRRDSAAIVFDSDHESVVVDKDLEVDAASSFYGFHCIFDQIQECLFQTDRVAIEVRKSVIQLDQQRDVPPEQFRQKCILQVYLRYLNVILMMCSDIQLP